GFVRRLAGRIRPRSRHVPDAGHCRRPDAYTMAVTVHPGPLAAAGRAAQQVADGPVATAFASVSGAEDDVAAARVESLECNAPLGSFLASWRTATRGIEQKTRSTGNKLVATANTHATTEPT